MFGQPFYGMKPDTQYNQIIGYVLISLDPEDLISGFSSVDTVPVTRFYVDSAGAAVPLGADGTYANPAAFHFHFPPVDDPSGGRVLQQDAGNLSGFLYRIPEYHCGILSVMERNPMRDELRVTTIWMVLAGTLMFLSVVTLMLLLLVSMVMPVNRLHHYIRDVRKRAESEPVTSLMVVSGCAEINTLSKEFNRLIQKNARLAGELLETSQTLFQIELEKQNAEIAHLRSQINPHFLYNALETINGIAYERGVPEIAAISTAMGKMFRYSIKGKKTVPLEEELEIARAYTEIQLARFKGKFEVLYGIQPQTRRLLVNKMMLQPILENAIVHGLEPKVGRGLIWVGSRTQGDDLILTVQDDGVGLSAEALCRLREQLENPGESQSIGILNVHARLRLIYGESYGISIESGEGAGTKVQMKLPVIKEG